jgi:NADH dehydrogenase FAD-containing subunit
MHARGTSTLSATPHFVIVGDGFAGLQAARALAKEPVRITLLDRGNHHLCTRSRPRGCGSR